MIVQLVVVLRRMLLHWMVHNDEMPTNGEDSTLASKLYQQRHQTAAPCAEHLLDGVKGTQKSPR